MIKVFIIDGLEADNTGYKFPIGTIVVLEPGKYTAWRTICNALLDADIPNADMGNVQFKDGVAVFTYPSDIHFQKLLAVLNESNSLQIIVDNDFKGKVFSNTSIMNDVAQTFSETALSSLSMMMDQQSCMFLDTIE